MTDKEGISESVKRVLMAYKTRPALFNALADKSPCKTIIFGLEYRSDTHPVQVLDGTCVPAMQATCEEALTDILKQLDYEDLMTEALQAARDIQALGIPYLCLCTAIADQAEETEEVFVLFLSPDGNLLNPDLAGVNAPGGSA